MKEIENLIPDIYTIIQKKDGWFNDALAQGFTSSLARNLQAQLGERKQSSSLRLSQMGPRCPKALWYATNHPELAEALPPWAEIKYSFGHIIEALAIVLAKATGHEVTGEQDELVLDGIVGHRDCVIDGCTVDVKSSSSIGFSKFRAGSFVDTFGYLDQLDGYVLAAKDDPLVTEKRKGYLLVVDKQLGHMCLYPHEVADARERALKERITAYKRIVAGSSPPPCECRTIAQGSSGNMQLDTRAGYSPFKYCCHPYLRTFLYASGPAYLTVVKRKPDVIEVDKHGKMVYN